MKIRVLAAVAALALASGITQAQVPQYGANITLDQAKKAIAAADAEVDPLEDLLALGADVKVSDL